MTDLQAEFIRLKRAESNRKRKSRAKKKKKKKARVKNNQDYKTNNLQEFERIRYEISLATNVTIDQINSKVRKREYVIARHMLMYFTSTFCTFKFIGKQIGGRDHTSAIHGSEAIAIDSDKNKLFKARVDEMRSKLFDPPVNLTSSIEMQHNFETFDQLKNQL